MPPTGYDLTAVPDQPALDAAKDHMLEVLRGLDALAAVRDCDAEIVAGANRVRAIDAELAAARAAIEAAAAETPATRFDAGLAANRRHEQLTADRAAAAKRMAELEDTRRMLGAGAQRAVASAAARLHHSTFIRIQAQFNQSAAPELSRSAHDARLLRELNLLEAAVVAEACRSLASRIWPAEGE